MANRRKTCANTSGAPAMRMSQSQMIEHPQLCPNIVTASRLLRIAESDLRLSARCTTSVFCYPHTSHPSHSFNDHLLRSSDYMSGIGGPRVRNNVGHDGCEIVTEGWGESYSAFKMGRGTNSWRQQVVQVVPAIIAIAEYT